MIQLRIVVNFVLRFEVDISIMLGMKYKGKKLCFSGPQGQFPTVLYLCAKPTALHVNTLNMHDGCGRGFVKVRRAC